MIIFLQALQSKHTSDAVRTLCFLLTRKFEAIGETIGECSWYQFPLKIQKELLTMLINAQKQLVSNKFTFKDSLIHIAHSNFLKRYLFPFFN